MFTPTTNPPEINPIVNYAFYQDISFGGQNRERMDVFIPTDAGSPTSAVIDFHGGGFFQGDKESRWSDNPSFVEGLLEDNIAFIASNYRFTRLNNEDIGFLKSIHSGMRAIQFVKYHADFFNINKNYIGLKGGSSGAGISQWVAYNEDQGDPAASNPVHKESTSALSISLTIPQSTYDYVRWEEDVFERTEAYSLEDQYYGYEANKIGLDRTYAVTDLSQIYTPEGIAIRSELDYLSFIPNFATGVETKILNNSAIDDTLINGRLLDAEHNVRHVEEIEKALTLKGLSSVISCSALGFNDVENDIEFFSRTLAQL